MRNLRLVRTVAALVLLAMFAAHSKADASPEDTVRQYFSALRSSGPMALADFIHTDDIERLKDGMQKALHESESDPEVAALLPKALALTDIREALEGMDPREFFRNFLKPVAQNFQELGIQFVNAEVIGSVTESKQVHVLVRSTATQGAKKSVNLLVATVKLEGTGWRLTGGATMSNFSTLAREFGRKR